MGVGEGTEMMDRRQLLKAFGIGTTSYFVYGTGLWKPSYSLSRAYGLSSGVITAVPINPFLLMAANGIKMKENIVLVQREGDGSLWIADLTDDGFVIKEND